MKEIVTLIGIPLAIALIVGLVLLVLEYRTHWFANRHQSDDSIRGSASIRARGLTSRKRGISITSQGGGDIDAQQLEAEHDINLLTTGKTANSNNTDDIDSPKSLPPA